MNNVLELNKLEKVFEVGTFPKIRKVHAVNGVSFIIKEEEVLGLVGESGSGKTTVSRLIVKLLRPTGGKIYLFDKDVTDNLGRRERHEYKKNVQYIFQDPYVSLNDFYSIKHSIERPLAVHKMLEKGKRIERIKEVLEICGLKPADKFIDKYPHELSGGQRQRVGIARTLISEPKLILADEPTSMLDVSIRIDIMNLLLDIVHNEKTSLLYITHDLAGAHYICDKIAVMYAGYIMEIGSSDSVINDPKHPYTQLLKKAAPKPEFGLKPEKITVSGETPDLINIPGSCIFYPRCPYVKQICKRNIPGLIDIGNERKVKCFLY